MRFARTARLSTLLLAALALPAVRAAAQNEECAPYSGDAGRVCDAGIDATRAFHPLAGLLVSGGNPVLGSGSTLGGLGHFSLTARANAVKLVLPELAYDGSADTVPVGDELWAPAPLVEGAIGIYGGMPGGLLSIDLLGSAQLLPTDQIDNLQVDSSARSIGSIALGLGYGVRVGVLREKGPLPGISVSWMRRDIPEIAYGDVDGGDDYGYAVDLHATNLRLVASKRLVILDLAAGLGWDRYTGDATIQFSHPITGLPQPPIAVELKNTRTMAFANAGLNMGVVKLTGEAGFQGGKDQELSTDFENFDTTKGKFFAGLGLRVGF
jgi:hypothetical protein